MLDHDLDAPNLNSVRKPHGRSRLFLEDDPPMSVEDDASGNITRSLAKRPAGAFTLFLFLLMVVVGTGGAFAWRYYGDKQWA
jgi:hypothetical protein